MTIIIVLAILMFILGMLEVFISPGFGVAGIAAIVCAVIDVLLIYSAYGMKWTIVALMIAIVLLFILLYMLYRSRTVERLSLKTAIESTSATTEQLSIQVGDTGRSLTRLALVGNALIEGKQVEVKSAGEFIDAGTSIRVTVVKEALIVVEKYTPNK